MFDAERSEALAALCRKYSVQRLSIFGSAVREDFDPRRSDFDFAVQFEAPPPGMDVAQQFFGLADDLEHVLSRSVDLVMERSVRNSYIRRAIETEAVTLYAA